MNGWFSRAAIDRIAECAATSSYEGIFPGRTAGGAALLQRYTELDPPHGLAGLLFPEPDPQPNSDEYAERIIFGGPPLGSQLTLQFYCFASLLELAVRSGYVDLSAWDQRDALSEAMAMFVERESTSGHFSCDTTLPEALSTRLKEKNYRVEKLETVQFNAFASLLSLETQIRNDNNARAFIKNSQRREWTDDLAFLITPEQFADTLSQELLSERTSGPSRVGRRYWNTSRGSPIFYGAWKMQTV